MSLISWNDYFVTGIDIIDEQHRWLIDLINEAATVLVQPYATNHEAADRLLDQLTEYAVFHFQTEARLMADLGVDKRHTEHHLASHADFAAHVGEMRERYERTGDVSGGELLTFLANWLIFHILSDDQVLGRQLVAIRGGTSPEVAFERAEGKESDPAIQAKTHALVDLYSLINAQYTNLQAVYQELENHKQHLEEMVAQRTEQLAHARDLAEAASRAKSAFLATISHEFRTPMNAISGMSWALQGEISEPGQREKLQIISKATARLESMLAEVLDMVAVESGELVLEPLDFSLHALLDQVAEEARKDATAKGLGFSIERLPRVPDMLHGDAVRMHQILGHLLSNAVKFTPAGSVSIRVQSTADDHGMHSLEVAVTDTGIGISADDIGRLFRPFEQLDGSRARAQGGAGLGLALCQRIAHLMGGEILPSSAPGQGSRFLLRIPVRPAHAMATQPPAADDDEAAGAESRPELDLAAARILLDRLRPLVAEDDIRALTLWHEASPGLRAGFGTAATRFEKALETYDFQGALGALDGLSESLAGKAQ